MKISISPLPKLIAAAEARITDAYTPTAMDLVHDRKRQMAIAVLAGGVPSAEFGAAAEIEDKSPADLASLIMSKPDDLMVRENERRSAIMELRALTKADDIEPFLARLGIMPIAKPVVLA